ncbi:hypothetical protein ACMFMG_001703 [Clarireedia jacksonii]
MLLDGGERLKGYSIDSSDSLIKEQDTDKSTPTTPPYDCSKYTQTKANLADFHTANNLERNNSSANESPSTTQRAAPPKNFGSKQANRASPRPSSRFLFRVEVACYSLPAI